MRSLIVFIVVLLSVNACTNFREKRTPVVAPAKKAPRKLELPLKKTTTNNRIKRGNAVWHLSYPESAELFLVHESGSTELIRIETRLSDISLAPGTWRIMGLVIGGLEFEALDEGAKFEFNLLEKTPSYVGSYFIECPGVRAENMREVRQMEFFNRFHFTSLHGTCEMVVGNDVVKVRRAWSRLMKQPSQKLQLGF